MSRRTWWWSRLLTLVMALALPGWLADEAQALTVKEMAEFRGGVETDLWGLGLVVGLPGTGDSGDFRPIARQVAALLEKGGSTIPDIDELVSMQNVAVVYVSCRVPREGGEPGDRFDVTVEAWHNATSLEGGRLIVTPLTGPIAGQGVYAFATGPVDIEGVTRTSGRVRRGARMSRPIRSDVIGPTGEVELVLKPQYAGWGTAKLLANIINQDRQGLLDTTPDLAIARDEKTVVVRIPEPELANPANFLGNVLDVRFDPTLLTQPARVIVNARAGVISVTGNVQVSPAVVSHNNLVVTTRRPPPEPTPEFPLVEQSRVTSVRTVGSERSGAALQDLLDAMKALDVPVEDQIAILSQLHRIGHLHAELIIE